MSRMTFKELSVLWEESCLRRKNVSLRTREEYVDILRNRVIPVIGGMYLQKIDGFVLDKLVDSLLEKKYSPKTIKNTLGVVRQVFEYAYRKDLIKSNPIDKMDDLPRLRQDAKIHYFTPDECKRFLSVLEYENSMYRALFKLLLFTGCRRGAYSA